MGGGEGMVLGPPLNEFLDQPLSLTTLILLLSVSFVQFHRFLREFKLCSLSALSSTSDFI